MGDLVIGLRFHFDQKRTQNRQNAILVLQYDDFFVRLGHMGDLLIRLHFHFDRKLTQNRQKAIFVLHCDDFFVRLDHGILFIGLNCFRFWSKSNPKSSERHSFFTVWWYFCTPRPWSFVHRVAFSFWSKSNPKSLECHFCFAMNVMIFYFAWAMGGLFNGLHFRFDQNEFSGYEA